MVARWTGIPVAKLSQGEKTRPTGSAGWSQKRNRLPQNGRCPLELAKTKSEDIIIIKRKRKDPHPFPFGFHLTTQKEDLKKAHTPLYEFVSEG